MFRAIFFLPLALLILLSGCATSQSSTRGGDTYIASFDAALEAVEQTLRDMDMLIESASDPGDRPFVVVGAHENATSRAGAAGNPSKQTLHVSLTTPNPNLVQIRVEAPASGSSYGSVAPREFRSRFLTALNKRLPPAPAS